MSPYFDAQCLATKSVNTVLLDKEQHIRICDFGFGKLCDDQKLLTTYCGSPFYAAPEMVTATPYNGPKVDIWSCGVILYAMLSGKLPFQCENMPDLFKKISVGAYNVPHSINSSPAALIARMLCVKPSDRASAQDILNHTWLSGSYTDIHPAPTPIASHGITSSLPLPGTEENEPLPLTDKVGDSILEPTINQPVLRRPSQAASKEEQIQDEKKDKSGNTEKTQQKAMDPVKEPRSKDKSETRTKRGGFFAGKKIQVAPLKTNSNMASVASKKVKDIDTKLLDKLRLLFRVPKKRLTAGISH